MLKYGANAFIWIDDWTTEKGNFAIIEAGKTGFDFIEIPLMRPWDFDPKPHIEALKKAGIGATASVILPKDAHMPTHPERAKNFYSLSWRNLMPSLVRIYVVVSLLLVVYSLGSRLLSLNGRL